MPKLTPCLWFDANGEEAAEFYVSVFPGSSITERVNYTEDSPGEAGTVMLVNFELDGQPYTALNGGPHFTFSEAVSFQIDCADQAEVDHYWGSLTADGGEESQCGWLKDRFGVSWQVVPRALADIANRGDGAATARMITALWPMKKIIIADLEAAAAG